jgi:hypothetical protein
MSAGPPWKALAAALLAAVLAACAGDRAGPPATPPAPTSGGESIETASPVGPEPTSEAPPPGEPPGPGAEALDGASDEDCVARCVSARQMQAVAIEKIEADCRAECGE